MKTNKTDKHKILLLLLKIVPAFMAFSYLMNTTCAFLGVPWQIITHYLGMFLAPMLYLYISSYVFKFCEFHRWFIHYMVVIEMLNITDWYWHIPVSNDTICIIHFIITAIFLIGAVLYYFIKKPKIF
jgi:hypothetical protein